MEMDFLSVNLIELFQQGSETVGVLDLPTEHWPRPGQYLPCQPVDGDTELLAVNLFRVLGHADQLTLGPIPPAWQPGEELICTTPQGHGFNIPASVLRVGLIPYEVSPFRLLSLVDAALSGVAVVAVFSDYVLPPEVLYWMPSQVEVLPLVDLLENPDWPDYLAIDLERSAVDRLFEHLAPHLLTCTGEVLIHTPMPCRGVGACGVCAVHTRRSWRFACSDGPVFPIAEVCDVA